MPQKSLIQWAVLPGLITLALTGAATAQITAAQQSAMKSSCRSDYMSNCMSVKPGGVEALQCLQKNMAKLSAGCRAAVAAVTPKPAAEPAPAATAAPPPPSPPPPSPPKAAAAPAAPPPSAAPAAITAAPPPPAAIPGAAPARAATPKTAVAAPAKPVTPPPKQAAVMPPAPPPAAAEPPAGPTPAQINAIKTTCRGDFGRNCKGVPQGGPEAIACLMANAAKLSPNCKIAVADIADSLPDTPAPTPAAVGAPPPPAAATRPPNAPAAMTVIIGRACMRDLIMRCRDVGVGDGQKLACLTANEASLAPLCKAALKGTASVR